MGSAILESLARSDAVFGFRLQNGELTTGLAGTSVWIEMGGRV